MAKFVKPKKAGMDNVITRFFKNMGGNAASGTMRMFDDKKKTPKAKTIKPKK